MSVNAFVGLGSNLGNTRRHMNEALSELTHIPQTRLIARSSWYRTVPYGVTRRQPPYLNGVAHLSTSLPVGRLLTELKKIERRHRRARPYRHAPRTLDLDLLLYGARSSKSRSLTLPHPRLHTRAFALIPLLEIAPKIYIEGRGQAFSCLLRLLGGQKSAAAVCKIPSHDARD
ncbi:MAG: 2-amino-4-hydroxy-6-hydroxymethyldihydropteridine diphosphokinase [Burkholderiales bacterium]|jgi:2-amino-4-hydroxy-6-hydroxymethyldihydropteridine diphosphokinase|nr:2-amino-4-hydroxy-6-hydroxymethyldihydropteridine diphosphokinase [Burkholderiales bacterium]